MVEVGSYIGLTEDIRRVKAKGQTTELTRSIEAKAVPVKLVLGDDAVIVNVLVRSVELGFLVTARERHAVLRLVAGIEEVAALVRTGFIL